MDSTDPPRPHELRKIGAAMDSLLAQVAMLQRDTRPEERGPGYRAELTSLQTRVAELNRERVRLAAIGAVAGIAQVRSLAAQLLSAAAAVCTERDSDPARLVLDVFEALDSAPEDRDALARGVDRLARDVALGVVLGRAPRVGTVCDRLTAAAALLAGDETD